MWTHKVTFKKSGVTVDVAEDEYILEEAEDAGLRLPYDCRSGTCTTCMQKCLEGEIDQDLAFAISDEELEKGYRLICIGSPLSDARRLTGGSSSGPPLRKVAYDLRDLECRHEVGEEMRPGTRVLLVEDDRSISGFVEPELERLGFRVRCAYDGPSGLKEARRFRPELVVLDIMLPRLDGVGVLKELRRGGSKVPVVMLTARDTTLDKVHSLDLGADDYVTKPFEMDELLARIRALLRRAEGEEILRVADLEVNTATREVRRGERDIDLTAREYELLEFMARNPRRVLSREFLLSRVWDQEFGVTTNVVEVYIAYSGRR